MNSQYLLLLVSVLSASTLATESRQEAKQLKLPQTTETEVWLQIQRENMLATRYQDVLPPEAAKASQKRLLKAFSHELPDKFIKDGFGEK